MSEPKGYTAKQVVIEVAGVRVEGYADGEFLTIEKNSDDVVQAVGSDGEVAVGYTADDTAKITIKLLQTSASNDDLSAMRTRAKRLGQPGLGPLFIRDMGGRAVYQAPQCWILKPPDPSFDKTPKEREWVLGAVLEDRLDGGNNPLVAPT